MMQRKGSKLSPIRIHQGVVVENMAQSLARNIFCDALLRLEAAGFETILHIHDEVLIDIAEGEAENGLHRVIEIMSTPPEWLPDIPLAAEGSITRFYTK
jgi:DNA polymerase